MSELAVSIGCDLPDSWTVASLEDVAVLSPKSDTTHLGSGDLVHFVPMAAVAEDFGGIDVSKLRAVDEVRKGYTSFAENDVLFAKITPCMENGKGAIVPPLPNKYAFGSTEFHVIRSSTAVLPKWIAHYLAQPDFRKVARRNMTGTAGQMRVPSSWLATIGVPVAPIAEQTRIVEKLEELLSDLDAGVAELKAAQHKLAQYRQSLLKAAVEGTLTADWRAAHESVRPELVEGHPSSAHASTSSARTDEGETGTALLQRILTERRTRWETKQLAKFVEQGKTPPKGWQSKYREPLEPSSDKSHALPQGWVWASLDQFLYELRSGTAETSGRDTTEYPVLKSSAVRRGVVDLDALNYLRADQSKRPENYLELGDVLITRLSGSVEYVGCCAVVCGLPANGLQYPDRIFCGKLAFMWLADYLSIYFQNPHVRMRLEAAAKSTAGHKRISLSDLYDLPIPLPPSSEIEVISNYLSNALNQIVVSQLDVIAGLKLAAAQRKNILKAAFAGQLVPQDPNDEPASALLKCIRAERATSGTMGGKRGRKTARIISKEAR